MIKHTCNKCGKEFDMWDTSEHFHIYQKCGYGTKFDGDDLELDLCCACIESLIDSCAISPIIEKNT